MSEYWKSSLGLRESTYVGEVNGEVKVYFAICDEKTLEDEYSQESLEGVHELLDLFVREVRTACTPRPAPRAAPRFASFGAVAIGNCAGFSAGQNCKPHDCSHRHPLSSVAPRDDAISNVTFHIRM
jgi:hypothetical protein